MTKLHIIAGSETFQSFELKDPITYVGRSKDNDIQIKNQTVSRKHLKIVRRGNKYFITDLKSRNGTYFYGSYIAPNIEFEVPEGVPIAIGMSLICLGEGCVEHMRPILDSIGFTEESAEQSGVFLVHKEKANHKKIELLNHVSKVLTEKLPINETLEKVLDYIFDFLKRIDRAAFILVDPGSEKILDVISKSNKPEADSSTLYSHDIVKKVIDDKKALVMSGVRDEEDEIMDTMKLQKIESVLCVPFIRGSKIMGVIYVDSQERPFGFTKEDLSLFVDLSQRITLAIEHARFASMNNSEI